MLIQFEKKVAIVGSTFSGSISLFLLYISNLVKKLIHSEEYREGIRTDFFERGLSIEEFDAAMEQFNLVIDLVWFFSILLFILGIISLVLSFELNEENRFKLSVYFITFAILHLLIFRLLSFAMLLFAGIRIRKDRPLEDIEEND